MIYPSSNNCLFIQLNKIYSITYLLSGTLPHPIKLVIAGNHELSFDLPNSRKQWTKEFHECGVDDPRDLLTNCTYLENQTAVVHGIKVYGAPW